MQFIDYCTEVKNRMVVWVQHASKCIDYYPCDCVTDWKRWLAGNGGSLGMVARCCPASGQRILPRIASLGFLLNENCFHTIVNLNRC